MFLYNAIREMLLCGDSCIASYDMKRHVMDMSHASEEGESGFETQFKVELSFNNKLQTYRLETK